MEFLFEKDKKNFEDYSSGRVLHNMQGTTGFPVRLASDIFQRGYECLGTSAKVNIYDPCCGSGYRLTVLGLLHGDKIDKIYASDMDEDILKICRLNLDLLSKTGIEQRVNQIRSYIALYNKDSHKEALESAYRLQNIIEQNKDIRTEVFKEDVFHIKSERLDEKVDIIMVDLPYGNIANWVNTPEDMSELFISLTQLLHEKGVIIVVSNEKVKWTSLEFKRRLFSKHGKRFIYIFQKL